MHHCHNVIFISTKIQDEFSLCTYILTFVADQLDPNCSKLKQIYTFFLPNQINSVSTLKKLRLKVTLENGKS